MNAGESFSVDDHRHMARALELARKGRFTTDPNPNVGCVIVTADGRMVGEGWHHRAGEPHAEVHALQAAGPQAQGATVYVTLEPCSHHGRTPPCADALVASGVARVICAMQDPNPQVAGAGLDRLRAAGIAVATGLLADAARELNRGFCQRMQTGRPWVTAKLAVSLDGRTAMASGESKWITGTAARADVQRLRAASSAILTGVGTLLVDDPRLDVRDDDIGPVQQPMRAIVDSALRTPPSATIFTVGGGPVHIFHVAGSTEKQQLLAARGAACKRVPAVDKRVSLAAVLDELGQAGCNQVLVEAGATLNGALLAAGLVDELVVYQSARVMGSAARGMFALPDRASMADVIELRLVELRHVGDDLRLTYRMA